MKRLRVMNEKYSYKDCNIIKVKEIVEKLYSLMEGNSTLLSKIKKDCYVVLISKIKNDYDKEEFLSITIIPYKINESSIVKKRIIEDDYLRINSENFIFHINIYFSATLKNIDICTYETNNGILMTSYGKNSIIIDSKIVYYLSILDKIMIGERDKRFKSYIDAIKILL